MVFFFLISCLLIPNRDYVIKGNVYQANNNPLSDVTVSEVARGTELNFNKPPIMTDQNGYYEINNPDLQDCSGTHFGDFTFSKVGYKDFTISVMIDDSMPEALDIIMESTGSSLDSRIKEN